MSDFLIKVAAVSICIAVTAFVGAIGYLAVSLAKWVGLIDYLMGVLS